MLKTHERMLPIAEQERLEYERRAEASLTEQEIRGDLNDEQREIYPSQHPNSSASGKIRRSTRPEQQTTSKEAELLELSALFGITSVSQALKDMFNGAFEYLSTLAATPAAGAAMPLAEKNKAINPLYPYSDKNCAFETAFVSAATADKMAEETKLIHSLVEEMEAATELGYKRKLAKDVLYLAEEFQMRQHPNLPLFVHEIEAVNAMEKKYNPRGDAVLCSAEVCVVRFHAGVDRRTIKRCIADVYNQAGEEVQLSVAERIALQAAQPVPPPPGLHFH